ncbi:preprotein translocase subunit SecG [Mycoplasma buteonis]|uniref:preprotein translocase subunit SecG n=1 Tax=Mycoplasma buteonis TaxID=171280 RepID=UPI00056365AC|nr:preprotein translocase subunit SecG [Mycoplasma buteonis]
MYIIVTLLIILGFFLVVISFLMSPDSNGFSGALVGSNDLDLFKNSKERGFKKFLKYSMMIGGLTLITLTVLLSVLANHS